MKIRLSDHFTYRRMLRFTFPSIMMMIFTSIYGIVDGFFISNYVGSLAFASVNLIMPLLMIVSAVGSIFGTGGSALISIQLGMGKKKTANEIFSFLVYAVLVIGTILSVLGYIYARELALLLGATEEMLPYCVLYARINMIGNVQYILQYMFQVLLVTAEKPHLGLAVTIVAGVSNMVLDWLFMGVLHFGVAGAAWATVTSQTIGGVLPLLYFALPNHSLLRLGRTRFSWNWLGKAASNGSSEFLSVISASVVAVAYNGQLLHYAGTNGVAAFGVLMYANMIFTGVYFGFSMGIAPVIGYHYGADDREELHGLFKKSLFLITSFMIILTLLAEVFAGLLARIFVGYDAELLRMTTSAFRIYDLSFIFMGYNIFGSSFFTALGNGPVSAFLSILRTLVFRIGSVYILPRILGLNGIWSAVIVAELLSLLFTVGCLMKFRGKYHY